MIGLTYFWIFSIELIIGTMESMILLNDTGLSALDELIPEV
jgi:hypothetical protein